MRFYSDVDILASVSLISIRKDLNCTGVVAVVNKHDFPEVIWLLDLLPHSSNAFRLY